MVPLRKHHVAGTTARLRIIRHRARFAKIPLSKIQHLIPAADAASVTQPKNNDHTGKSGNRE